MNGAVRVVWSVAAVVVIVVSAGQLSPRAADSPQTVEKMILKRKQAQTTNLQRIRMEENARLGTRIDGGGPANTNGLSQSIVVDQGFVGSEVSGTSLVPPPPSPGLAIGTTSYDYQHNESQGHQTGRYPAGADIVHFVWMAWNVLPSGGVNQNDRFVSYNSYTVSTATLLQGSGGVYISINPQARAGYANLDVEHGNQCDVFLHQRSDPSLPYRSWRLYFPIPGDATHEDDELSPGDIFPEILWPHGGVSRVAGGPDIVHVVSHGANEDPLDRIVYWRYDGTAWAGPVRIDSNSIIGYVVAADDNSAHCAIVLHSDHQWDGFNGMRNIAYYESATRGAGWISGTELGQTNKHFITNYSDPSGPEAFVHISTGYNSVGDLQVIWDEQRQAGQTHDIAIRHWSKARGTIRPVALGYWPVTQSTGVFNLNLAKMTMGFGDGGTLCQGGAQNNLDYVYVVYTQFAGPSALEQADYSALGYYNGELYLNVSNSGGNTWSPPENLTNTKTPNCNPGPMSPITGIPPRPDSVCRSEHWATVGRKVHNIDIFYISDVDAGGIPQGEGTWNFNKAMYLRLPGGTTDAPHVCPVIAANYVGSLSGRTDCELHAALGGTDNATLTITNLGNATMSGEITASQTNGPPGWLSFAGGGAYSVPDGDPDKVVGVILSAAGISAEGLYQGTVSVTHNDPSKPSPQDYPVDFFVFNQFFCPEKEVIKTGVASPGSLALEVSTIGRYASENDQGGLWRYVDSSSAIFDATILVAYGPQSADTIVYHRFYDRTDIGQAGFWSQASPEIDTSRYSTGTGYAKYSAVMSTKSKTVLPQQGELVVKVDWFFPQSADSDEFVIGAVRIYNRTGSTINNVIVGLLEDQDVVPASRYGTIQRGVNNLGGSDVGRNLVWQRGVDTVGTPVDPAGLKTATRYAGGIRVLYPTPLVGAYVGNNIVDMRKDHGPSSSFLYRKLVSIAGIGLYSDSVNGVDMYTMVTLGKGITLGTTDTARFVFALVSDTTPGSPTAMDIQSASGIRGASDKAADWAGKNVFKAEGLAAIMVNPPTLNFGAVGMNLTSDLTVNVSNIGGAALVGSASTSAPFSVPAGSPYNVAIGGSTNVTIRFAPTVAGTFNNIVTLTDDGSGSPINVPVTGLGACICTCHGDPTCDGVTDVLDVVATIDVAFRGVPAVTVPSCPRENTDVDCSGTTDVVDVVKMVNVAFRGADKATEFRSPCSPLVGLRQIAPPSSSRNSCRRGWRVGSPTGGCLSRPHAKGVTGA